MGKVTLSYIHILLDLVSVGDPTIITAGTKAISKQNLNKEEKFTKMYYCQTRL